MLKLKRLQILGFKSFCDRTDMKFEGDGIAAIVGPNGCGKSNISDAISWVLGEQSAKTLRGSRMEDVIFAGTRDRKPTGMAEVSLTLIDPEIFEGPLADLSTEVEAQNEFPADDWDEAGLRRQAAEETERVSQELQPGVLDPEEDAEGVADLDGPSPLDVVLKVRRRQLKRVATRAGQIVVTRRLFRSGESAYLMNGKLCRLRDIQELFLGTGLGPETYAIIEQGRIGQILSSKPHDRRAIIEEAAGITKFKTKKRLAEARLEQAQQNLARVNDIFEEVTRQMNSLKRQASKAERYVRLRDEMRGKLRLVLAGKLDQLASESVLLEAEQQRIAGEMQGQGETVTRLESEQGELTRRGYSLESEIGRNRERGNELALEADRAAALRRHNEERCSELAARAAAAEAEVTQTSIQLASLLGELQANRAVVDSAQADVSAAQQEAALRQQEAAQAGAALEALEREQEQRRSQVLEAHSAATALRNQVAQAEGNMAALDREAQRLHRELQAVRALRESSGGQRGQLALEFDSATSRAGHLSERIAGVRKQIESGRAEEAATRKNLDALRAAYAAALGKQSSLETMIAEHGYSTESVKRLMQNGRDQHFQPVGVLSDFLE
ncbi:MAG: AAA family ATPase, partial [Terriglobales bacterium]